MKKNFNHQGRAAECPRDSRRWPAANLRQAGRVSTHRSKLNLFGVCLIAIQCVAGGTETPVPGPSFTTLDLSFESKLSLVTNPNERPGAATGVIVQPDGRILVNGTITALNRVQGIARLHPDGAVDLGFRADPLLRGALAVQPDGRIIARSADRVVRLLPDGSPDTSFSSPRALLDGAGEAQVRRAFVQADGKIILHGNFERFLIQPNPRFVARAGLARLNADGSLDENYVPDLGILGFHRSPSAIHLDAEGRLLFAGEVAEMSGNGVVRNYVLARLNPDGSRDRDFKSSRPQGGILGIDPSGTVLWDNGTEGVIQIRPDGSRESNFRFETVGNVWREVVFAESTAAGVLVGEILRLDRVSLTPVLEVTRLNANGSRAAVVARAALGGSYAAGLEHNYDAGLLTVAPAAAGRWLIARDFTAINGVPRTGLARIFVDASGPPNIGWTTGQVIAFEESGAVRLTIQRTGAALEPASIDVKTRDSTARAGKDHIGLDRTVSFAAGEFEKTISIPVVGNPAHDGDRSFEVILGNPRGNAGIGAAWTRAIVRIVDDERPGSLDWTFQNTALTDVRQVLPLADGQLLVVGATRFLEPAKVWRLSAEGSLDERFKVCLGFDDGQCGRAGVEQAALLPDGRILLRGEFEAVNGHRRMRIARLQADGTIDRSFNPRFTNQGDEGSVYFWNWRPLPDGKLMVYGEFDEVNGRPAKGLVRLNVDGSPDESFRVTADAFHSLDGTPSWRTQQIFSNWLPPVPFVYSDGRLLFFKLDERDDSKWVLHRLNADGSVDPSFHGGFKRLPCWTSPHLIVREQADGKLLVQGYCLRAEGAANSGWQQRLNHDGTVDDTFRFSEAGFVTIQPDGKILVGDSTGPITGENELYVRLNPDGSRDPSFKLGPPDLAEELSLNPLGYQPDGKLIATGDSSRYGTVLTRITPDGTIDLMTPTQNRVSQFFALPDGRLLVMTGGGEPTWIDGIPVLGLARLNGGEPRLHLRVVPSDGASQKFTATTRAGRDYALEASPDLIQWSGLQTNTATGLTLEFEDAGAADFRNRFYRARRIVQP